MPCKEYQKQLFNFLIVPISALSLHTGQFQTLEYGPKDISKVSSQATDQTRIEQIIRN
jgi:hypothetical protein